MATKTKHVPMYTMNRVAVKKGKKVTIYEAKYDRSELLKKKQTNLIISELKLTNVEETTTRKAHRPVETEMEREADSKVMKEAIREADGKEGKTAFKKGDKYETPEYKKGDKYVKITNEVYDLPVVQDVQKQVLKEVEKYPLYCQMFPMQIVEIVKSIMG